MIVFQYIELMFQELYMLAYIILAAIRGALN